MFLYRPVEADFGFSFFHFVFFFWYFWKILSFREWFSMNFHVLSQYFVSGSKFSKMSKKSRWKNRKSKFGFDSSIKLYVKAPKMWTKYWCHTLCCPQLKKMSNRVFWSWSILVQNHRKTDDFQFWALDFSLLDPTSVNSSEPTIESWEARDGAKWSSRWVLFKSAEFSRPQLGTWPLKWGQGWTFGEISVPTKTAKTVQNKLFQYGRTFWNFRKCSTLSSL